MAAHFASPLLTLTAVTVSYPHAEQPAIENVNLELLPGTMTMLIGPNGSGKSTLLKAILGVLPFQGQIIWSSTTPTQSNNSKLSTQLGYVPQRLEFDLDLPLSVRDFLSLALLTCHHDQATKDRLINESLQQVRAETLAAKLMGELSGGQRQRVVLARALLHHPQLLILDEPATGIDVEGELLLYQLLHQLVVDQGMTVVLATHELEMVAEYADQVVCLNRTLVCSGAPQDALTTATYNKMYGQHKVPYHHHHHD